MMSVEDLFDRSHIETISQDVLKECNNFGTVVAMEIPAPQFHLTLKNESDEALEGDRGKHYKALASGEVGLVSRAHGKIFVKFGCQIAAKQARYGLSGRTYNGRTVVGSFYPEHLFD